MAQEHDVKAERLKILTANGFHPMPLRDLSFSAQRREVISNELLERWTPEELQSWIDERAPGDE